MSFEDHMWEIIRKQKMSCEWRMLPKTKEIPVVDSENDVQKMLSMQSMFDDAVKSGIITKRGAWYYYGKEKLGLGEQTARDLVDGTPDLKDRIYESLSGR